MAGTRRTVAAMVAVPLVLLAPVVAGLQLPALAPAGGRGPIEAGGAFTCDFGLPSDLPLDIVGPGIERDRMYMAERPGMLHKHIPFVPDPLEDRLLSGGRYLFETDEQAHEYFRWVREEFALDDVLFFDRPVFLDPDCHSWTTVGAHEWGTLEDAQVAVRTERWMVPHGVRPVLQERWPGVMEEAEDRGLSAVWLLHNEAETLVSLVYFADRLVPGEQAMHPMPSIVPLALAPPLGEEVFGDLAWERTFDRSHWVLTIWYPFVLGDQGKPSLWPSSPPLPEPYAGDGVCEVSRGEDHMNAPEDCLPTCGNAVADPGETTMDCPGDVRPPWTAIP